MKNLSKLFFLAALFLSMTAHAANGVRVLVRGEHSGTDIVFHHLACRERMAGTRNPVGKYLSRHIGFQCAGIGNREDGDPHRYELSCLSHAGNLNSMMPHSHLGLRNSPEPFAPKQLRYKTPFALQEQEKLRWLLVQILIDLDVTAKKSIIPQALVHLPGV